MRAQAPFATTSVREVANDFTGPKKYLNQRDTPLEIPYDVILKLFKALDQDKDDRVSLNEMINYCKAHEVVIPIETLIDMFNDAAKYRRVTNNKQYNDPLSIEEI
jgi:hypothetical protein